MRDENNPSVTDNSCEVIDEENDINNLGDYIGQYEIQETVEQNDPVPEECLTELESTFHLSQMESREFHARSDVWGEIGAADDDG